MTIQTIKKRDGRVVPFRREKIQVAMEKAAQSVNAAADLRPFQLMVDHVIRHVQLTYQAATPDVEGVQDLVEKTLLEHGHYDIGKAYILYRAERAKVRDAADEGAGVQTAFSIIQQNGDRVMMDEAQIRAVLLQAAKGLSGIDIDLVMSHIRTDLHVDISNDDLGRIMAMAARSCIERDPSYSKLAARLSLRNLYQEVYGDDISNQDAYRKVFIKNIRLSVETGRLSSDLLSYNLSKLANALVPERDDELEYLGVETLYDRYLLQAENDSQRLETPQAMWMRVAMGIALNEEDKEARAIEFYNVMSRLDYLPSSPTLFHSGTKLAQMSSCYLSTVEDSLDHIFKVYGDSAQLSKYAGGLGVDWTNIRGTGAWIGDTNITSQGVIPFLRIANDVTVAINRSGRRRGATCAYLETWHYDVEDFLDLRRNTGDERRRTHDMNTANWIPDLFMKRVNNGEMWSLFSPEEVPELHHLYGRSFDEKYNQYEEKAKRGEIKLFKQLPAKDLWRKMITMLFETGHPWITFKDASNIRSPQDHVGVVHNSNLCTEITLNTSADETAVCNLGSVNLSRHIADGGLDKGKIAQTVAVAMRMLDNVIDLNYYPTVEARKSNMSHRPVGLGVMGFQDALFQMDIDFDSDEAVRFADLSMEIISYHALHNSALLAKERGAYTSFKGSKWDRGILPLDTLDLLEKERGMPIGVMRTSALDWRPVRDAIKRYGMRNSNSMAIAPTATLSNISGCFPCVEPIFKNLYVKANISGDFTVVNTYLVQDLKKLGLWNQTVLEEIKRNDGSIENVSVIPPRLRAKYKEAFDIDAEWFIKSAAYRGKWIDQSQSLNIFFKGSSGRRLNDVYMMAWHMGLKTTYYLRSVAASSVEKSTVELDTVKPGISETTLIKTQEVGDVSRGGGLPMPVVDTVVMDKNDEVGDRPKLCLITDPDCEACQ